MGEMASQITSLTIRLLNRLIRGRSKKASKPRVAGFCAGNSSITGEFPAQRAGNAEHVSIWWRHHVVSVAPNHEMKYNGSSYEEIAKYGETTPE